MEEPLGEWTRDREQEKRVGDETHRCEDGHK